jgi:hypothetical protein
VTKSILFFVYILIIVLLTGRSALARWGTLSMTDDKGDQVLVKHGLLGKKTMVKDRNGNGFKHSRSIFGLTKDTQVGVLGNEAHVHKGLLGFGKTEGHDILGDSISSKKNPLFRNTNVNLSGANAFVEKMLSPKTPLPQTNPNVPGPIQSIPNMPINSTAPGVDLNKFPGVREPAIQPDTQN